MRIYLDACSLNRPFDDHRIDRNRLEAEAVLIILQHVHAGEWEYAAGDAVELEIDANPDSQKREAVRGLLVFRTRTIPSDDAVFARASVLHGLGFQPMDAVHIASAEAAACDVLLTTDDAMLRRARRLASDLRVRVANPLDWIKEQFHDDRNDAE
jgi:predicted nucleic acid-binding protein